MRPASKSGSPGFGVSAIAPSAPREVRATRGGTIAVAGERRDGALGERRRIADGRPRGDRREVVADDVGEDSVHSRPRRRGARSPPPFTREQCFRTVLSAAMSAPDRGARGHRLLVGEREGVGGRAPGAPTRRRRGVRARACRPPAPTASEHPRRRRDAGRIRHRMRAREHDARRKSPRRRAGTTTTPPRSAARSAAPAPCQRRLAGPTSSTGPRCRAARRPTPSRSRPARERLARPAAPGRPPRAPRRAGARIGPQRALVILDACAATAIRCPCAG